jgi:hypothetical protein
MSRKYTLTCGVADLSFPRVAAARGIPDSGGLIRRSKSRHSRLVDSINAIFRSARHLLDLALATNSLVDIIEFFEVDEPVDVIASRE